MNFKIIRYFLGKVMIIISALMLAPFAVSLYLGENILPVYAIPIILLAAAGLLCIIKKPKNTAVHIRDGIFICTATWLIMSLFGAVPFYISGAIPSFTDAFFETVSGFTTTGSTILTDIEALPKSLLFWRSFTHWIGGMGVLVFALAIFAQKDTKTMYIMRAEAPGPKAGKLVSKMKYTERILYLMYIGLTVLEIVFLLIGKMPLFDSVTTALSTAGTGGFGVRNNSIAAYSSPYIEYVVTIFMILFGVNFSMFYYMLIRNFKEVAKNDELRWYFIIIAASTILIWGNIASLYETLESSFRAAFFQVGSIITTTGFMTADYNNWPVFSQIILILLMFCGACAGSTGGGLKVVRVIILIKTAIKEVRRSINPRAVVSVKLDNMPADSAMVKSTKSYFILYLFVIVISTLIISLDKLTFGEVVTSVITCINNIGPGIERIGPAGNFAELSVLSKWVLSFDMLAGRLELIPVIALMHPKFWR